MSDLLSDHLIATREALKKRGMSGLFLFQAASRSFVGRVNTFIAMAEELEEELRIANGQITQLQLAIQVLRTRERNAEPSCQVLAFPKIRVVRFPSRPDGGDAA